MKSFKRLVIPLVAMVFISMFMAFPIFPAAAQLPSPKLEVRSVVIEGDDVAIEIWATNVVEDWEIIGFQFSVPFETEWLAPASYVEGTFMEAFVNGGEKLTKPNPYYTVVSDIPYTPDWYLTKAMVMIMPDPSAEYWAPFPSGEGLLVTLHYTAIKYTLFPLEHWMPIDIIDITILDQNQEEVPYETPLSGSYTATVLTAFPEFTDWKLKVNGKAGIGIGHKSTVRQPNLLEADVNNPGTDDINVQVLFEVEDAAGAVTPVYSDIVLLPAGQSTILYATWTATKSGVYYITAYLSYGLSSPPPVPDGCSRTLTLRVDAKPA